ncbi:hypothetical protein KSP40_PGU014435 [Platanthera guangdongensis]|uniref:Uncharacterized protein n=1 Tax=Platanthera guangdongensis TaxID=2320717 RepID=A0ABR2LZU1_9ASPA
MRKKTRIVAFFLNLKPADGSRETPIVDRSTVPFLDRGPDPNNSGIPLSDLRTCRSRKEMASLRNSDWICRRNIAENSGHAGKS